MRSRILFIGGTPRGYKLLKMLINNNCSVVYAYIMEEDKHESVKVSKDLKELCVKNRIPSMVCKRIDPGRFSQILKFKPDVAFVCGWRTLISPLIYRNIPMGCIAAHDSLLPKYRGFAPLNWAVINGEKQTGVTLFKIGDGVVDSGEIFKQKAVEIKGQDTAADVYSRICDVTVGLYKGFIHAMERDMLKWHKQDETKATYTCKRIPEDGEIDWTKSSADIFNLIRALSPPYPCAWTRHKDKRVGIEKASLPRTQLNFTGNIPGRVVSISKDGVLVLCGAGQIILNRVVMPTGEHIEAKEIFYSISTTLGR
jgi:methionyl-tRNA formyltransferase